MARDLTVIRIGGYIRKCFAKYIHSIHSPDEEERYLIMNWSILPEAINGYGYVLFFTSYNDVYTFVCTVLTYSNSLQHYLIFYAVQDISIIKMVKINFFLLFLPIL